MTGPSPVKGNYHFGKEPIVTDSRYAFLEAIKVAQLVMLASQFISGEDIEQEVVVVREPDEAAAMVPQKDVADQNSDPESALDSYYEQFRLSNTVAKNESVLNTATQARTTLRLYQADDGTVPVKPHGSD